MPRRAEHGAGGAAFDQIATLQHRDLIGNVGDDAEIMRDEENRCAVLALQLADQIEDLRLGRDVERRRRLVGDQQARIEQQSHGDHRALALTAAQLVGKRTDDAAGFRQMNAVDQFEHAGAACGFPERRVDAQHFIELAADRVQRVQRRHRLLEDHADFCATNGAHLVLRRDGEILAFEQDTAAPDADMRAGQQAKDRTRYERFARSALADQACHLAGAQHQIDIAHRIGAVGA